MERIVSHATIVAYHKMIADAHLDIKGFYRFNWNEINNAFRSGVDTPALLLESHDSDVRANRNQTATFNERTISFMLLDYASSNDYDAQELVLDKLEKIGLDICSLLDRDRKNTAHWLWGKFDGSLKMEKVGPVFDSFYGWNIVFSIKNQETMCFDENKWNFNV